MSKNLKDVARALREKAASTDLTMEQMLEAIGDPQKMHEVWKRSIASDFVEVNGKALLVSLSKTGGTFYQLAVSLMPESGAPDNDTCDMVCRAFFDEPATEIESAMGNTRQFIWRVSILESAEPNN